MHTLLTDYVRDHGGNQRIAGSLVEQLISGRPPSFIHPKKAEKHYHSCYKSKAKQKLLVAAMQGIVERALVLNGCSYKSTNPPAGLSQKKLKEFFSQAYLHEQALIYAYYGVGNCAQRACYAAIQLAKAFQDSDVRVVVKSIVTRDHYIVFLKNATKTLIYDPLTNPERLYEASVYKKEILQHFPIKPEHSRATEFQLDITADEIERLNKTLETHHEDAIHFGEMTELEIEPSLAGYPIEEALKQLQDEREKSLVEKLEPKIPEEQTAIFFTYASRADPSTDPSATNTKALFDIADTCLFAVDNGLPIKACLTEEQTKTAEDLGLHLT